LSSAAAFVDGTPSRPRGNRSLRPRRRGRVGRTGDAVARADTR
jgi:hypothetical protein